jgi:hypothetical protein
MWLTSLNHAISYEMIKVAADSRRGQTKTLADDHSGRWPILQNGAGDGISGAELIDFHNSIVS